jgi:hypothetical protein
MENGGCRGSLADKFRNLEEENFFEGCLANNFSSRGQLLAHGSLRELSISSDIWTGKAFLTGYTLQE